MFETLKILCVMIYSQATMLIPSIIRGETSTVNNEFFIKCSIFNIGFLCFQTFLYYYLPSLKMSGSITPEGNIPLYNNNGFIAFSLTLSLQYFLMKELYEKEELISIIDNLGSYQWSLNVFGFYTVCAMIMRLKLNNNLNEPKRGDNLLLDFYRGVELHPQSNFGDIKLVINSRFGMMLWACIVLLVMYVSDSTSVLTSGAIQLMYITKFYLWEEGYVKTTDITMDRCGYYLFWGCICYVPTFYTSPIIYHYYNPVEINKGMSNMIIFLGYLSIFGTWLCDMHRVKMREFAASNPKIAEKMPFDFIKAKYKTLNGVENQSWLITSSYYRFCRHPSYLLEIISTIFWTLPGYIPDNIVCYLYLFFLITLLVHRTYRIDKKCTEKYNESWLKYKLIVPYKIIPCVF